MPLTNPLSASLTHPRTPWPSHTMRLPPRCKKTSFGRAKTKLEKARAAIKYLKAGKPLRITTEADEIMDFLPKTAEHALRLALLAEAHHIEAEIGKSHGVQH